MLSLVRLLKRLWDESQGAFTYEHENPLFSPRSPTKTHAFLFNVSARIPFHLIQVARENFPSVDIINLNQSKSTNTLLGNHLSPAEESTFETKKSRAHLTCVPVCLFNYCHLQYITVTACFSFSLFNYSTRKCAVVQ